MPINFTGKPCASCKRPFDEIAVAVFRLLTVPNGSQVGILLHHNCAKELALDLMIDAEKAEKGDNARRERKIPDYLSLVPMLPDVIDQEESES